MIFTQEQLQVQLQESYTKAMQGMEELALLTKAPLKDCFDPWHCCTALWNIQHVAAKVSFDFSNIQYLLELLAGERSQYPDPQPVRGKAQTQTNNISLEDLGL